MERTLVVLKPDAIQRGLIGRAVQRFEDKGLQIVAMKMMRLSRQAAARMYRPHKGKDFYVELLEFMTSGPLVAMVLQGNSAIAVVRAMMGATFGPEAAAGTIRGDFGMSRRYNLVHGSDSPAAARREIPIFFGRGEMFRREPSAWVYASRGRQRL